jgi:hypothetical protein
VIKVPTAAVHPLGTRPGARATSPEPPPQQLPAKKPMARAIRVTLFEREVRERLSASAVDLLFERADVLSEGRRAQRPTAGGFFGSTMITIELLRCAEVVRERCEPALARRLAVLMARDSRVLRRAQRVAEREAERLAGERVAVRTADVRVRAQGTRLHIDVDVEGPRESG